MGNKQKHIKTEPIGNLKKIPFTKWAKVISFVASIGFISIAFFESSIATKKELIDSYNYQADILHENIRDSENDYDIAFRIKNHIELLTLLKADKSIIIKTNGELISLLQMAAIGVLNDEGNPLLLEKVNNSKTFEELQPLYESGLLSTVNKANQLIQNRDQVLSEKNKIETYKIWFIYLFILLSIISFGIEIRRKDNN